MRLIDADVLKSRIKQEPTDGMYTNEILEAIDEQPTVDAVEVVRCKDCKHRYGTPDCHHPLLRSYSWGAIRKVKDDDFCSYGERRSDE